ncbi:hypothetical protein [Shewanella sp. NIFS-20-20]|uniref:hypothetical protein n=1 Tax=Shewanella sp. NIFS-20-20 TaxID=2853806 RepID=UPI001C48F669|nr:hypothetical protein [Shewanella sp. NIFS-20-20]MBV7314168.1 hypothetical protein [Shewanella sp. NIFS-20-20]
MLLDEEYFDHIVVVLGKIVDAKDTIIAKRPYREANSVDTALAIMSKNIGTAIDRNGFIALKSVKSSGYPKSHGGSLSLGAIIEELRRAVRLATMGSRCRTEATDLCVNLRFSALFLLERVQ